MNLETYDKTVAPPLMKIESGCGWLTYYAKTIQSAVGVLPARPANETMARAGLNLAEQELMIALAAFCTRFECLWRSSSTNRNRSRSS